MLLTEYWAWLKTQDLTESTRAQRHDDIIRFMTATGVTDPLGITSDIVMTYLSAHRETWSDNYRRGVKSSLAKFYTWAWSNGRITEDIARQLPKIACPKPRPRPAPTSLILDAFELGNITERAILALGAQAGLRRSEIASLQPSQRHGDTLHIIGKGHKLRRVPLSRTTLDLLLAIEVEQPGCTYYFPGRTGGHIHPSTVYKHVRRELNNDYGTHTLRHRAATDWLNSGVNIRVVQELLGHASVATTQIYTHVTDDDLRDAVAATDWGRTKANRHHPAPATTWSETVIQIDLAHVTLDQANAILQAAIRLSQTRARTIETSRTD